jgi:hypothetical protein
LIVHVYFDLFGRLGVAHCEAIANFDFLPIFTADAEEGADYAFVVGVTVCVAAERVVEDGEYGLAVGRCELSARVGRELERTWGCIMTFRGAVVGCEPGSAGPRGRARWRKESASTMTCEVFR